MSSRRFCDICKKDITNRVSYRAGQWLVSGNGEYCEKCWSHKGNWPKIHKIKKRK